MMSTVSIKDSEVGTQPRKGKQVRDYLAKLGVF